MWVCSNRDGIKKIRVLSVKTALSTLCEGRLIDKLRCRRLIFKFEINGFCFFIALQLLS